MALFSYRRVFITSYFLIDLLNYSRMEDFFHFSNVGFISTLLGDSTCIFYLFDLTKRLMSVRIPFVMSRRAPTLSTCIYMLFT